MNKPQTALKPPTRKTKHNEICLTGCLNPNQNTNQHLMVDGYQLRVSVCTPQTNASVLHMTLWGHAEGGIVNHAEIDFIEDNQGALPVPDWLPGCNGKNIIHLWYHRRDFPLIAEILRCSKKPRCYYFYQDGKVDAGIKDWPPDSDEIARNK